MDEDFNQLKALTEVVKDAVSHKEHGSSKRLMYFIKRSLNQVGLTHECEESEILIQAYLRTRDKILAGARISNSSAYLTRVAYFVILDESKRRNRRGELNKKLSYVDSEADSNAEKAYTEGISHEQSAASMPLPNCGKIFIGACGVALNQTFRTIGSSFRTVFSCWCY